MERLIGLIHDEGNDGHFIFPWRSFLFFFFFSLPPFSFFLFHGHAQPLEAERKGEGKGGGVRVKDYEGSRERRDQGERGDRRNFSLTQMSDKGIVAARLGGRHRAKHVRISIFFYRGRKDDIYIYIWKREGDCTRSSRR